MSKQSDNSNRGSEGNGDSLLSSYQNSPRRTTEFGSAGPFGDHCTDNKSHNCFIFMMNNDSSPESDDQQTSDLKAEYRERLNLIRQKLADIDIANYGSYYGIDYPSCYSPRSPRCQITEISNESPAGTAIIDESATKPTVSNKDKNELSQEIEHKTFQPKAERKKKSAYTESAKKDRVGSATNVSNNKKELTDENCNRDSTKVKPVDNVLPAESTDIKNATNKNAYHNSSLINASPVKNPLRIVNTFIDSYPPLEVTPESKYTTSAEKITSTDNTHNQVPRSDLDDDTGAIENNFELKTIFKYDNSYDPKSSTELIDLNYNPPKKKCCVREKTPKLIMSDGAMSLPYHIRVSLHSGTLRANSQDQMQMDNRIDVEDNVKRNTENLGHTSIGDSNLNEEKNVHIFPEVKVDGLRNVDHGDIGDQSSEMFDASTHKQEVSSPRRSAGTENDYNVFFFDAIEQSPSESIKSHNTIITETTFTDSPSRKPKRRRLLLRSAQNKVKPVDTISLWEEIRTMEALTNQKEHLHYLDEQKQEPSLCREPKEHSSAVSNQKQDTSSSSSLESYFKNVILSKKGTESSRFPSFTRITKFCSAMFRKKSADKEDKSRQSSTNLNENKRNRSKNNKRVIVTTPQAAYTLQDVRKEQDLDVQFDRLAPSRGNTSKCSTSVDEEDDSYYDGMCRVCFCF